MKQILASTAALAIALSVPAAAANAAPPVKVPTNCHELNELLHIDNVRDCDNGS